MQNSHPSHGLPTGPESNSSSPAWPTWKDPITFPGCAEPTVGVELEVSLIDPKTGGLAPRAPEVLEAIGDPEHAKPELFSSIVEVNTDKCYNVAEIRADMGGRLQGLQDACDKLGLACISTGAHPFSAWRDMPISDGERYSRLVDTMQWPARRLLICGMHVHVGVKSGEHAIALLNAASVFLPHLLALSGSSPFWAGLDTGMASSRVKVFEGLPTAGLPPHLTNWNEFAQLMRTLLNAGSIKSIREIWWDIRPHPGFGTLEVRICDGVNTLDEVTALTAFVQCLIAHLQKNYDQGQPLPMLRHWTLRENKWRASRYGLEAKLIRNEQGDEMPLMDHIREWLERLQPTAEELGCADELAGIHTMLEQPPNYARQRAAFAKSGSLKGVVDALVEELRSGTPYHP